GERPRDGRLSAGGRPLVVAGALERGDLGMQVRDVHRRADGHRNEHERKEHTLRHGPAALADADVPTKSASPSAGMPPGGPIGRIEGPDHDQAWVFLRVGGGLIPDRPTLARLREAAAGCRACDLWKRGTQTVFGEGAVRSAILLVG